MIERAHILAERLREFLTSAERNVGLVWRIMAWVGSIGLGLTAFLEIENFLRFEYHSSYDIVSIPAFILYAEEREWWLYLLALASISLLTLVGYAVWTSLVLALKKAQEHIDEQDVSLVTLTFLLWWVRPLTLLSIGTPGPMPSYAVGGLFVALNGVWVMQRWLERRSRDNPACLPPPLPLQGAMAIVGAVAGSSLLRSPGAALFLSYPLRTVVGAAVGVWGVWLAGSYLLCRLLQRDWRTAAVKLAIGCLPLSLLSLQSLLWWETYQAGEQVAQYGSPRASVVLYLIVLLLSIGATLWVFKAMREPSRGWEDVFWRYFRALTIPFLLFVLTYRPTIHGAIDLFHEGEQLSPAQAMMAGQIPYRDVVFVHGFMRDAGLALLAFRIWEPSVAALRTLENLLSPLAAICSYFLALICLESGRLKWALLYSFLLMVGLLPGTNLWIMTSPTIAVICATAYIRWRRVVFAIGAGIFSCLALLTSFDIGLVTLVAIGFIAVAFSLFNWRKVKATLLSGFFAPLFLFFIVLASYFAHHGALTSLLEWHRQLLSASRDWNGMPFPVPPYSFDQLWDCFFCPLASVLAALYLANSLLKGKWQEQSWTVLLLLAANVMWFNRGVLIGSLETRYALQGGSYFAPFVLLALMPSWRFLSVRGRLAQNIMTAVLLLGLLLPAPTKPVDTRRSLLDVIDGLPAKTHVQIPDSWVRSAIDRVGPLYLPAEQEAQLAMVVDFLGDAESFWDFTDHGALFFLSDHLSPTRFYATHHIVTAENQRQVVADLERNPPQYVLYRSGTWWDAIRGVDRTLRNFLVSEYLLSNYHPVETVGGFIILGREGPPAFPVAFRVDLGYVPFLWGRDRLSEIEGGHPTTTAEWLFSRGDLAGWQVIDGVAESDLQDQVWHVRTATADPQLLSPSVYLDPGSVTYAVIRMRVAAEGTSQGQLFWRVGDGWFDESHSLLFRVVPDGEEHIYLLRLASFPSWAWSGTVTGFRFDPVDAASVDVFIRSIELVQLDELAVSLGEGD